MSSAHSESPSPIPESRQENFTLGPLTSHIKCADYIASSHPEAQMFDLNAPLDVVPTWSFESLKLPVYVDACQAEVDRQRCTLSLVDWDDPDSDSDDEEVDVAIQPGIVPASASSPPGSSELPSN